MKSPNNNPCVLVHSPMPEPDILEVTAKSGKVVLRINAEGIVFVNGKKRFKDKELKRAFKVWIGQYLTQTTAEKLLKELINVPPIKIPFWILQNKKRLESIDIYEKSI